MDIKIGMTSCVFDDFKQMYSFAVSALFGSCFYQHAIIISRNGKEKTGASLFREISTRTGTVRKK